MTAWSANAPEPFAGNAEFWRSVGASVDALLAQIVVTAVVTFAGPWAAVTEIVPAGLLLIALVSGRRSERETRPQFATHDAWRRAERDAVGSVLAGALVRRRWRFSR